MEKTLRYRIYTELKNLEGIKEILNRHFEGYTIYPAMGVWKGKEERSLVIEVIDQMAHMRITQAAIEIKHLNEQEAVFTTCETIQAELI